MAWRYKRVIDILTLFLSSCAGQRRLRLRDPVVGETSYLLLRARMYSHQPFLCRTCTPPLQSVFEKWFREKGCLSEANQSVIVKYRFVFQYIVPFAFSLFEKDWLEHAETINITTTSHFYELFSPEELQTKRRKLEWNSRDKSRPMLASVVCCLRPWEHCKAINRFGWVGKQTLLLIRGVN